MGLEPLPDDKGKVHIGQSTWGPMAGLSDEDPLAPLPETPDDPDPLEIDPEDGEEDPDDLEASSPMALRKSMRCAVSAKQLFDAGASEHKGLLVSLWLDAETAQQLAVPGGEPADQLHVTLGYCGNVEEIGDVAVARAVLAVDAVAAACAPLAGSISGSGRFSASASSGGLDALYAVPDVPGLAELRHAVAEALRGAGVPPRADHGWSPHITLAYVPPGEQQAAQVPSLPLAFGAVTLSVGSSRADLPLGRPHEVAVGDAPDMRKDARLFAKVGDHASAMTAVQFSMKTPDSPPATRIADRTPDAYTRSQLASWGTLSAKASASSLSRALKAGDYDDAVAAFGGAEALHRALTEVLMSKGRPVFLSGAELALSALPLVPRNAPTLRTPLSVSLTDINPASVAWARREAAELVKNVSRDTKEALRELMVLASEGEMTVEQVARAITRDNLVGLLPSQARALRKYRQRLAKQGLDADTVGKRAAKYAAAQLRLRAMTIARTELLTAVNAGQQALWEEAVRKGVLSPETKRVWIVTLDDALCLNVCEPMTDETAGMDEPFPGGYMHPPAHPRCRCAIGIESVPRR